MLSVDKEATYEMLKSMYAVGKKIALQLWKVLERINYLKNEIDEVASSHWSSNFLIF